jgi:hypothetical protein
MQGLRRLSSKNLKPQRRLGFGFTLLSAILLNATMGMGASALDFKCVEPSRYKNLLQIFEDNPVLLTSYFGLNRTQLPDMNACRALVVTGTIHNGDAAALMDNIIQNKGGLDVLYLSFDGVYLQEEIKLAHIIRGFWLKTRVLQAAPFRYDPDFATLWGSPAAGGNEQYATAASQLSPLNHGLEAFAKRGDLGLPITRDRNACIESCAGVWMSGVDRRALPTAAISVPAPAAAAEIVTAWPRSALAASLDSGKIAPPNDPSWKKPAAVGTATVLPPAADRMLRNNCAAELLAGEALEDRVGDALDMLARNDFRGPRGWPPDLLAQFDSLRKAGVRLQRCVARAFESTRLAAFGQLCKANCDKTKLLATFDRTAREFVDNCFSVLNIIGASQSDKIGREWREEEPTGPGTWIRRGTDRILDATWTPPGGQQVKATLEMGRVGNRIAMVRTQVEGRCIYQGDIAADEKSARGTFVCSWTFGTRAWNATISE